MNNYIERSTAVK